jgi:TRAP-type C4-dicarboxylate transport system permease small subunit
MINWKIISKIAMASAIVFAVFMVLAGVITYEIDKLQYTSAAPASFIDYTIIAAMLPFMGFLIASLAVAVLSSQAAKPAAAELEPETQEKATQETETEPDVEDVFKETPT